MSLVRWSTVHYQKASILSKVSIMHTFDPFYMHFVLNRSYFTTDSIQLMCIQYFIKGVSSHHKAAIEHVTLYTANNTDIFKIRKGAPPFTHTRMST